MRNGEECKNCAYWRRIGELFAGTCDELTKTGIYRRHNDTPIKTVESFGCCFFKERSGQ